MKQQNYQNCTTRTTHLISTLRSLAISAMLATSMLMGTAFAQTTLQLRYTFGDGPGTTTTSSGAIPVTLNMVSSTGAAVDLHGGAGSGVQGQGTSLNISTNNPIGNVNGAFALTTANGTLGAGLGLVSNFTATVWFKMSALVGNAANTGSRLFFLGTNTTTGDGGVNTIGLGFGVANGTPSSVTFPVNTMQFHVGSAVQTTSPVYYNFPTNEWLFVGVAYDSGSGITTLYYGSEASPAKLYTSKIIGAGTNFNFGTSASLSIGNRVSNARDFAGSISDFRFYTGVGNASFMESVRQASTPVVVSGLTPDGSVLMSGTNTLSFTATSANGVNTTGVHVAVNGSDVTSSLLFTPTAGGQIVTYTNLPVNPTLIQQSPINGVNVNISVADAGGIVTSNSYTYDAFTPNNFTWEAEDYDFAGGQFIDNPVLTFVGAANNTYYQEQQGYINLIDANDAGDGVPRVYRDPGANVETEYSVGAANNGGNNIGELMRQKVLDAYAVTNIAGDINVGFFSAGTGSGLPNWMNYTRTYPSGNYNVYVRVADGGGTGSSSLDQVTSGFGTSLQTITNLGTFSFVNSGGWDTFAWVPLRDVNGNLARVSVAGQNTIRLTAATGGGGNVNFLMLIPANTNLPSIIGLYPNGTNMFQPAAALTFTATSPSGATINASGISVKLTVTNLLGQGFVTNITSANGLVVTGSPSSKNVSLPLTTNLFYTAVISVTDVSGSPAGSTVSFDTLSPIYTWEAEDYDYNDGQFFDNPQTNAYVGLAADPGVDSFINPDASLANTYRGAGGLGDQADSDSPPRLQYIGTGFTSYNVGWYDTGDWGNYTRTYPTGAFNLYVRAANGSGGNLGDTVAAVTSGVGTPTQTTTNLGTFTIPNTGNWQGYEWAPLRDAGGNLVKVTLGGKSTLRVTANPGGGGNVIFYALFPANTNLPALNNIFPDGTAMFQSTNTFAFNVQSTVGVATNSIVVTVNGVIVTNLVFSGSSLNRNVTYPHLLPNTIYTVTILVTDINGNTATATRSFDTFSSTNYTWEGEDFDFNGGQFIDNPQTNAYSTLAVVVDVDTHQVNFGGADLYRPNGMDTEVNGDVLRAQYKDPANPQSDYTMGFFSGGANLTASWANYTRHYPAGSYNVYGRLASGGGATTATLSQVTSGWGTTTQTTNFLGNFNVANTGWEAYNFVPLRDGSGNLVTLTFNGSTNTLQVMNPLGSGSDVNVNFFMLVAANSPLILTATTSGGNINISFPTQNSSSYQLLFKNNLTDPTWTPIGSPVAGNGSIESISQPIAVGAGTRFYLVQVQ